MDANLFAARRLGSGLKIGEALPAPPREWAMEQLRSIPKLDFYGQDGGSFADALPPEAQLVDYPTACLWFGAEEAAERQLDKKRAPEPERWSVYAKYLQIPHWAATMATTCSAINGPSPVFERFWQFWCNHFCASTVGIHLRPLIGAHIQTIRAAMTGSFENLLYEAVNNPAIVYYLDNVYSVGPHSGQGRRFSLNENLGRELLELYTVSPAAGYTQKDVIECALILTGWTFSAGPKYRKSANYFRGAKPGRVFNRSMHEPGSRTVMGKTYRAANRTGAQLKALIADLAAHPSTAKFIATKLVRAFVADDPPQDSVDRVAATFTSTKGDLVAVHSAVVDEALTVGPHHGKFAKPSIWLQQAHRTLDVMPTIEMPSARHLKNGLVAVYDDLGEPFAAQPQPNGWPDTEADWLSKAMLDRRVRYANTIALHSKPLKPEQIGAYVDRLMGPESTVGTRIKRAQTAKEALIMLLVSPQFLRI